MTKTADLNPNNSKSVAVTAQWRPSCSNGTTETLLSLNNGGTKTYTKTGTPECVILTKAGNYKFELWGANGGSACSSCADRAKGGYGSYASGTMDFTENSRIYIYVGGAGANDIWDVNLGHIGGGYDGGGDALGQYTANTRSWGAGGGATDVRLVDGNVLDFDSLKTRIMVAAGGGGAFSQGTKSCYGGSGGGLAGYDGNNSAGCYNNSNFPTGYYVPGTGASQTSGGIAVCNTTITGRGTFGTGGINTLSPSGCGWYSAGGGGGWYGGGPSNHVASAGGGSSFIAGHNGSNAINITSSTSSNIIHTNNSTVTYNGKNYIFTNTTMIDGMGYSWTSSKGALQAMPNPTSTSNYGNGVGHIGNGYARITYLGN